jgi:PBP1b-binding outer membrane lipoprotein LpoB
MAKYDTNDTVPVRDIEVGKDSYGEEYDSPLLAIAMAEENKLGPNNTIVDLFTPDEKAKLNTMIRKGKFTQLEGAVIHALMSEAATLEDIGAMLGAVSRRTKGKPTSKAGAIKELNRILQIIADESKAKFGRTIDLSKLKKFDVLMKKARLERAKKAREARRRANEAEKEYWRLLKELRATQKAHGLRVAKQVHRSDWEPGSGDVPYIHDFAKANKNIDTMPEFGGKREDY